MHFELALTEFAASLGRPLEPRLTLRMGPFVQGEAIGPIGDARAREAVYWTKLEVLAPFPLPAEDALRRELIERLDEIFGTWFERGLDRDGPRETGFACHGFDPVTGERYTTIPGSWLSLWDLVLDAVAVEPRPEWSAALAAFLGDYVELGIHPETGFPRKWDCLEDRPLDGEIVLVTPDLRFLLDVHERGPVEWRERALTAAVGMGEAVLAHGQLPDGSIAPKYTPATGAPDTSSEPMRWLNLPAQLARLGAATDDERFSAAAHRALAQVEFTHRWEGAWDRIDPDFDDRFGNLGEASVIMHLAHPADETFGRLARSGWEHFGPLWRDALRYGGSVAADQVRCWDLLIDYARARPELRGELAELLEDAVRAHLKGEQFDGGAWGDVTHVEFAPVRLEVGDATGAAANLLWGLGLAYDRELGLPERIVRGLYTGVLRSTVEHYRRDFGYLETSAQRTGRNAAGTDLRVARGLVAMLQNLAAR